MSAKKKKNSSKESSLIVHARELIHFLSINKDSLDPLLILTHDFPDPDSIASAYALQFLADQYFDIQSQIVYGGIIGRMENREFVKILRIPLRKLKKTDLRRHANVALVDTQPSFENNSFPKNRRARIVVDQHPSVEGVSADLTIIDPECAATSVILAQALLMLEKEIPVRLATALAYGILSDTLNLYRTKRENILKVYLDLVPLCDLRALARIQNPPRSRSFFVTLGKAIQKTCKYRGLLVSHLGEVENPDSVSQAADFLLNYQRANWSLSTGRYHGKLHVSLRTGITNVKAGEILRDVFENRGEAGGHSTIAGGSFKVSKSKEESVWEKAEKKLTQRLMKRLRISLKVQSFSPFK